MHAVEEEPPAAASPANPPPASGTSIAVMLDETLFGGAGTYEWLSIVEMPMETHDEEGYVTDEPLWDGTFGEDEGSPATIETMSISGSMEDDDGRSYMSGVAEQSDTEVESVDSHGPAVAEYTLENDEVYNDFDFWSNPSLLDEQEMVRQEFQYELCLATFENRLHLAPIVRPRHVLDAGCGSGRWVFDFAEEHPESNVTGIDLRPADVYFSPPNASFVSEDLEEPWNFTHNFDYIHAMMMTGALRDWPQFIRQSFDTLNPGGWLELQDIDFPLKCDDDSIPADNPLRLWSDSMMLAAEASGFALDACGRAAEMMEAAGFVEVARVPFRWPINRWPADRRARTLGAWAEANFLAGLEAISVAPLTSFLHWPDSRALRLVAAAAYEWPDTSRHGYFDLYITYGRKPGP